MLIDKWKQWGFWRSVRDFSEKRMKAAWFIGGNCDSGCPRCKQWESCGNEISTKDNGDGSVSRSCANCGNKWDAVFTPAGFVVVDSES